MATISFNVVRATPPLDYVTTGDIADADLVRVVAAFQSGANTAVNGTATEEQVLDYWISQMFGGSNAQVVNVERQEQIAGLPPVEPIKPVDLGAGTQIFKRGK